MNQLNLKSEVEDFEQALAIPITKTPLQAKPGWTKREIDNHNATNRFIFSSESQSETDQVISLITFLTLKY